MSLITVLSYLFTLLVGGAGGYLYGAKVKVKAAAVVTTVKADVKKL